MLLHGQLVVQMKAEITDDSGRLYSRQSYSKWAVQAVQAGRICLRPEPDSFSFVGIQLQATWFAPSADIVCAAWETHAQRVGVARLTTIMELSVVSVYRSVTVRHVDPAVKQCLQCTTQNNVDPGPSLEVHCSRLKICASPVLRECMIESDRLNMTQTPAAESGGLHGKPFR